MDRQWGMAVGLTSTARPGVKGLYLLVHSLCDADPPDKIYELLLPQRVIKQLAMLPWGVLEAGWRLARRLVWRVYVMVVIFACNEYTRSWYFHLCYKTATA